MNLTHNSFYALMLANGISYFFMNWIGLFILILLVYRIRHTEDKTFLKVECVLLVGAWVLFSILHYGTYVYNYTYQCKREAGDVTHE